MKRLSFLLITVFYAVTVWGQWNQSGNTISTNSNEIILNNANSSTSTLWLNNKSSGPTPYPGGNYYIKAFDYWGATLHFVGTGDQGNERMNVTFDGKVGIGTTNINIGNTAINNLVIGDASQSEGLIVNANSKNDGIMAFASDGNMVARFIYNNPSGTLNYYKNGVGHLLTINSNGNTGIGLTDPNAKLETNGELRVRLASNHKDKNVVRILPIGYSGITGAMNWTIRGVYQHRNGVAYNSVGGDLDIIKAFNGNTILATKPDGEALGNVGIGETSPQAKLHVSGDILADEIRVEDIVATDLNLNGNLAANNITVKANGNTADFVFEEDYNLRELSEVENFIKTNKHLPDIPSAVEMEEQGVNLAEMNKLLLQKIEELTIYAIEKDKRIEKLEGERNKEQGEREKLEERLERLEKLLLKEE